MLNAQDMIKTNTIPRPESFHEMSDSFRVLLGQTKGQGIVKNRCAWKGQLFKRCHNATSSMSPTQFAQSVRVHSVKMMVSVKQTSLQKIGLKIKLSTIQYYPFGGYLQYCVAVQVSPFLASSCSVPPVPQQHLWGFPPKQACLLGITTWERSDKSEDLLYLSVSTHFIESTLNLGSLYSQPLCALYCIDQTSGAGQAIYGVSVNCVAELSIYVFVQGKTGCSSAFSVFFLVSIWMGDFLLTLVFLQWSISAPAIHFIKSLLQGSILPLQREHIWRQHRPTRYASNRSLAKILQVPSQTISVSVLMMWVCFFSRGTLKILTHGWSRKETNRI